MSYKLILTKMAEKQLTKLADKDKKIVTKVFDLMESVGQIGEPMIRNINIWRYRCENTRIFFTIHSKKIIIVEMLNGEKYDSI